MTLRDGTTDVSDVGKKPVLRMVVGTSDPGISEWPLKLSLLPTDQKPAVISTGDSGVGDSGLPWHPLLFERCALNSQDMGRH